MDKEKHSSLKKTIERSLKDQEYTDKLKEVREQLEKERKEDLQQLKNELTHKLDAVRQSKDYGIADQIREFIDPKKSIDAANVMLNPGQTNSIPLMNGGNKIFLILGQNKVNLNVNAVSKQDVVIRFERFLFHKI